MENKTLDKKIITAKEAAEVSKNNTYADSILESSIMPQIKMAATKGKNSLTIELLPVNVDNPTFEKLKLTLSDLGYKIKQEYQRTLHIGW
jgi:hypothetical protein